MCFTYANKSLATGYLKKNTWKRVCSELKYSNPKAPKAFIPEFPFNKKKNFVKAQYKTKIGDIYSVYVSRKVQYGFTSKSIQVCAWIWMKKKNSPQRSEPDIQSENERLYFRLSNNNSLKSFRIAINLYISLWKHFRDGLCRYCFPVLQTLFDWNWWKY